MPSINGYFAEKKENLVTIKENTITGKKYRISILSDRLVRIEYHPNGIFENRASERVVFRRFPKVNFMIDNTETLLQIKTSMFTLNYVKEKPITKTKMASSSNIQITLNNTDRVWYYGNPEIRNFGGINYSLDNFKGNLKQDKGFYSTDGFALLDDSLTDLIDEFGKYKKRDNKAVDLYVFMYKKDLGMCLQDYYTLTGYPALIPRYALGLWWYKEQKYNNQELYDLTNNFINRDMSISGILLGNNSNNQEDNFNFDNLNYQELISYLKAKDIKLGITYNPTKPIKPNTYTYQNIQSLLPDLKGDYNHLPLDETKLNILLTYGIKPYLSSGIDAFYIDYNNVKDKETLSKLTNHFFASTSFLMNKRTIVLSRNHNIAPHRSTIIYTGNTKIDWNTLTVLPKYFSAASNNGISYITSPIGGFYGGIENFELYLRYTQLSVFNSIFLIASDDGKYYKREPWRWNLAESEILKKYINLRYKLIPYIYTESYIYSKNGSPVVQPLYYKYPKIYDEPLYKNQYFFGSQMLVCPITKKKNSEMNRVVQRLFIPEGIWYELESGKKYLGNKYYMSFYKDEDYPVFCKEGSIIVMSNDHTHNLPTNLEVSIFPGSNGSYQLYEDDGLTNNYKNLGGAITNYTFNYEEKKYEFKIDPTTNPGLVPQQRNYRLVFKNTRATNVNLTSGTTPVTGKTYLENNDLIVEVENISSSIGLIVTITGENPLLTSTMRLINDDIKGILEDLEIETTLKERIDDILFGDLPIKKKRIAIRKLKKYKLEPRFIKMFLKLLEYIKTV